MEPLKDMNFNEMRKQIINTLNGEPLQPELVIAACGKVAEQLHQAEVQDYLRQQGVEETEIATDLAAVREMLDGDRLRARMKRELGETAMRMPLGTLLHISAGNAYGLPAFSVLEGLLTGNINILKLPGQGDELSLLFLEYLIQAEPRLAEYIYVFGIASSEQRLLGELARLADAVVVWGGDQAVQAVRALAPPNLRLIEWGHKISFAYLDPDYVMRDQMNELAVHMCSTQQLYCNSCQGIYLDTDDFEVVKQFAREYADCLAAVSQTIRKKPRSQGIQAQLTLQLRRMEIESMQNSEGLWLRRNRDTSVLAMRDSRLESALKFGNCWVKPLPADQLIPFLKPNKSYLQTAALYCREAERDRYGELLFRAGVDRVTTAEKLSSITYEYPHDGEYALRRYCRMITQEK